MNEKTEALKDRFFTEVEEFLSDGKKLLRNLAKSYSGSDADSDDIHELFRNVHSIKSEASYLKLKKVSDAAHILEEQLELLRTDSVTADEDVWGRIGKLFADLTDAVGSSAHESTSMEENMQVFNSFERQLLQEAEQRGEDFYIVNCDLDPEAPMKQARAYLLLSNLEQIANVIRMEPSIRTEDDDAFASITLYLTSSTDESTIYAALEIDQVIRTRVEQISFLSTGVKGGGALPKPRHAESPALYRIHGRRLNQLAGYAEELRLTLREIDLDLTDGGSSNPLRDKVTRLSRLSTSLFEELKRIRTAEIGEEFDRLRDYAQELAQRVGKRIHFEISGEEVEIDRRMLLMISDPLNHLVRNAIDHGIESPDNRVAAGKSEDGRIELSASAADGKVTITVADDGRGIDSESVARRIEALGEEPSKDLLEMISRPGFTTLDAATEISGRGVGLDLVTQRVGSTGGEVRVSTEKAKGTVFTIVYSQGPSFAQLLFFRFGSTLFGLPNYAVGDVKSIAGGDLKRSGSGRVYCRGIPAFIGEKPAMTGGTRKYGSYSIVVSYQNQKACFLADDVLFEHDIQVDLLDSGEKSPKRRYAVSFGSGKREFVYLSPSLIQEA